MLRIIRAFGHSAEGFTRALQSEAALRQELVVLLLSLPAAWWISADPWRRAGLVALVLAVIVVELLNTCVEKLCDHVTPERHPAIKQVKDMGSAAVLFACVAAGIFWLLALGEKLHLIGTAA